MGRSGPTNNAKTIKSVNNNDNPMIYLLSNSDEGDAEVKLIRVVDQGSRSQCAKIVVGGVFL